MNKINLEFENTKIEKIVDRDSSWPELVKDFLYMLKSVEYNFKSSPEALVDAMCDFHNDQEEDNE
jgi:hypothetical protein